MARENIELRLRRTGGLAGLPMVARLQTRELEADEAERFADALGQVDLARLEERPDAAPGAADMFHYQLEILSADGEQTVHFGERQMPAVLAPVVQALMQRSEIGR